MSEIDYSQERPQQRTSRGAKGQTWPALAPASDPALADKRALFVGFLDVSLVVTTHIVQAIAGLVTAFALGGGWWSGLTVFAAIGLVVGFVLKRRRAYWLVQIPLWIALAAAGLIMSALT